MESTPFLFCPFAVPLGGVHSWQDMAWVVGCHGFQPASTDRMNLRRSDQLELKDILQSVKVGGNAGKLQEILKSLAEKKKVQVIFVTLELLRDKGFDFHSSNYLVGISACAKSKLWQHACLLFSSLPEAKLQPDVKSFNAAVSACEKGGQWQQAANYIARMPSANIQPNVITYSSGISACEKGGQWQQALNLFDSMQEAGVQPNVITYSAVISAFEKGGQWQQALSLFDHMTQEDVQPDVICFNAALSSLEKGSQWQQAWAKTVSLAMTPNETCYSQIMSHPKNIPSKRLSKYYYPIISWAPN